MGPDISKYFFNGIFYCKKDFSIYFSIYEEIPGNNLFMIFYLKKIFFAKTLQERKS
jgi:hypothetical protein